MRKAVGTGKADPATMSGAVTCGDTGAAVVGSRLMKRLRVYVDTSVIGGCFDEEFAKESRAVVQAAREGRFVLLLSDLAPREVV